MTVAAASALLTFYGQWRGREAVTIVWRSEVEVGTLRDDAEWINRRMAVVVVPLNVVEVHGLRDYRMLVKVSQVVRQVGVIHDALSVALEVIDVDRIEPNQRREQANIGLSHVIANEVALPSESVF